MSLFETWKAIAEQERSKEEAERFWNAYFDLETGNYKKILENHTQVYEGQISELAGQFGMDETEFAGFLDGINTSLKEALNLESLEAESSVRLDVDFEKLYFNMLDCKAEWLYTLPQWDGVLSEARRKEIAKEFRTSKIFVKPQEAGRNDPCPCGSGKKYKKCCGKEQS